MKYLKRKINNKKKINVPSSDCQQTINLWCKQKYLTYQTKSVALALPFGDGEHNKWSNNNMDNAKRMECENLIESIIYIMKDFNIIRHFKL